MKTKILIAWVVIVIIGMIPGFLLLLLGAKDYSSIPYTLGRIAGLIGMTFFALSFILSTRVSWIEDIFGGLDKVYPVHSVLGAASLILILLHPLLLVIKFIPENIQLAATYLIPGGLISVDFGIFALAGMVILLIVTLYGKFKYHNWKMSHEFLGVFFVLAVLHVLLVRGDVARDFIFNGYYIYAVIVSIIGLGGFGYSLLRTRLFALQYKVTKINELKDCYEIYLNPIKESIRFKAGQFLFITFNAKGLPKESHPFSIATATSSGNVRIIMKNLGDFTAQLSKIRVGDKALVEGPYGRFHSEGFKNEIWIAGGIGITPFLGLAKDIGNSGKAKIDLFYTVVNKDDFVGLEELTEVAKSNKNFHVYPWITKERGYLTVEEIAKIRPLKAVKFYICGPQGLKESIKKELLRRNIAAEDIYDERFAFK